jgi:hypothetical protein
MICFKQFAAAAATRRSPQGISQVKWTFVWGWGSPGYGVPEVLPRATVHGPPLSRLIPVSQSSPHLFHRMPGVGVKGQGEQQTRGVWVALTSLTIRITELR